MIYLANQAQYYPINQLSPTTITVLIMCIPWYKNIRCLIAICAKENRKSKILIDFAFLFTSFLSRKFLKDRIITHLIYITVV